MTKREAFEAVINGTINEEVIEVMEKELANLALKVAELDSGKEQDEYTRLFTDKHRSKRRKIRCGAGTEPVN